MSEIWKEIPGYGSHYEASSLGRIRVRPRVVIRPHSKTGEPKEFSYPGRELSLNKSTGGYMKVTVVFCGKTVSINSHILVAEAFHGVRPHGLVVCHCNGIPYDNRPENLRWDTQLENNRDRTRHGTVPLGEKHPMARMRASDIEYIRANNLTTRQVRENYGISNSQAFRIVKGDSWKACESCGT